MKKQRTSRPLDPESLRALALHHVGRYATSRAKLIAYLRRKLRERGWESDEPADPDALADRFVALGYVDDAGYAAMKGAALTRRGMGPRRVGEALREAGIGESDRQDAQNQAAADARAAADRFARRKRIGPYAATPHGDPRERQRHIAAFLRAGHAMAMALRWVDAPPGAMPEGGPEADA